MADLVLPPGVEWPQPPTTGPVDELSGRGLLVNETDLPDSVVHDYVDEHASVLGVNIGNATLTSYGGSEGGLLARSKFRTPTNVIEEVCLARDLAERDDDVAPSLNAMCSIAFGDGMAHTHPTDEVAIAMFDELAANANLDAVWLELYREWLISAQVVTVSLFTRDDFHFVPEGADRQRQRSLVAPLIGVLPAENVRVLGNDIFGTATLALKPATARQQLWLSEFFDPATTVARQAEMRREDPVLAAMVVEKLPAQDEFPTSWNADPDPNWETDLYRLNPRMVHRTTAAKGAWSYPRPFLTRDFSLLEAKRLLNLMDYALLQGGCNFLVIAKKGTDLKPARQPEVDSLRQEIGRASRTGLIVGDHRLTVEIITPELGELLNPAKRNLLGRKLSNALLRVPEADEDAGGEGMKARVEVIQRVLESDRRLLKRHIERHVYTEAARRNRNVADRPPKIWFPKIILSGSQVFLDYSMKLRDRADISRQTAVGVAGFDWDTEVRRRRAEKPDDRVMTPPPVPFSSPNQGPQDNQPGRPRGSSQANGAPGSPPSRSDGAARARPRQVVQRTQGETVVARFTEELGSYRIGQRTEELLEQFEDTAELGRVTQAERDALARITGEEWSIFQSGAATVVPVNPDEDLDVYRAVRLSRGLSVLVGERSDGAAMARALVFREPEYDELAAQEATLRFGFQFELPPPDEPAE